MLSMFGRLGAWFREQRAWKLDHLASWPGWTEESTEHLSRLQVQCEAAFAESGIVLHDREVRVGDGWLYVFGALVPGKINLWLHPDTVEIKGSGIDWRLEEWDARTPQDFISRTLSRARELLAQHGCHVA